MIRPNEQRAKYAITLIWIILVLEIVSLISLYYQWNLLQTVSNGGEISTEVADANDNRELIVNIVYLFAFIISGVTFIQWFRRAYFNLHLKVNTLSYTEGWAAGSWFVPIISLVRPYKIMRELYIETKRLLKNDLPIDNDFSTKYLGIWWALWVISSIIGQIVYRIPTETVDQLIDSTILSAIGCLIGIPLALITIKIIKDYSDIEPLIYNLKNQSEIDEIGNA